MGNFLTLAVIILLVIGIIILVPWLSILAVGTLMGTTIPVTFKTWLAMAWIHIIFAGGAVASQS